MRAVIPVAGLGSRLRPHTYTLPKVLLNVGGKPILGHILDKLIEQNIRKATIITGYMGKLVHDYVQKNYDLDVNFVSQKETLGLGHAIWMARETFDSEPLMIILGDTIFDADLSSASITGFSTIGVKQVEDPRRFGVVILKDDGCIQEFIEKPEAHVSNLAIVGIYYIANPMLLKVCLEEMLQKDIRTKNEYQLTDALQLMLLKGEKFRSFPVEGWYDCGKPETLLSTNRFLLSKYQSYPENVDAVIIPPVFIAEDAVISRSIIGPYTTVASGAIVKNSIIQNSIISDNAKVTKGLLSESIIGNHAVVKGKFSTLNVGNSSEINYK